MATSNHTSNVLNFFSGKPIAQRFIDDPELFALAIEMDCANMDDDEIAYMDWCTQAQMKDDRKHFGS